MQPSCFTPIGLWRCSRRKPTAQALYEQARAGLGGQFSMEIGSTVDAIMFANSIVLARAQETARAASLQRLPQHVSWLLPNREEELGIIPAPDATMLDRREEYARRFRAIISTNQVSVEAALTELLGDDFVALHLTSESEIETLSQVDGLDVNYQLPFVERKLIRLASAVSLDIGGPAQWVDFEHVFVGTNALAISDLVAGDALMVNPGQLGLAERVEVLEVDGLSFRAVFEKPHPATTLATTCPYPGESTTKRHSLVVLTEAAALDPETRRVVNQLMRLYARSVSTWDIAAEDAGSVKVFEIGTPAIGIATTATIAL